ncbi:hypothetical protein L0B70_09860 [Kaistella sp. 97-N-M2]|uniref:ATP-grasp fold amidoligase family protein n=1 Tax=Kaistella sp. 97-N-M2 TaxID=2908645 RepID=UPI001F24818C|nr:ATP-grasp fold amidoligase family protein [Kaistella sp. 97-N-M2]UJF29143.1 hypothetical protein L0B70_09860 [Kaistella sp. 97-N-M2]
MSLRNYLVGLKNRNAFLYYLWSKNQQQKGIENLKNVSDLEAIKKLFHSCAGKFPELEQPKTFSDKMQWLKLNYHNELTTVCADKYEVRKYLTEKGYSAILAEIIGVYTKVDAIPFQTLPQKFVIKATHGSGWNLICTDKSKINWFWWKKTFDIWLNSNIFWPGREWPYKNMPARILVEKFLTDKSGLLMDYKLFCFNGKVHFVQANKGRDTANHAQNFYDLDWQILPFGKDLKPRPDIDIEPPAQLSEMVRIAEDLAHDFPFVRVDFYEVEEKIVFGEMTFYPKSGLPDFTPPEYDQILGELLTLPTKI